MIRVVRINYDDLIKEYTSFLDYAIDSSDFISLITYQIKPFITDNLMCEHDKELSLIKTYLKRQIVGIRKWSNNGTKNSHAVMNIYLCSKKLKRDISTLGNFLLPQDDNLPEDIGFYKKNRIWIATVSHEKLAFLYEPSERDIAFLKTLKVRYCVMNGDMEIFKLPIVTK